MPRGPKRSEEELFEDKLNKAMQSTNNLGIAALKRSRTQKDAVAGRIGSASFKYMQTLIEAVNEGGETH